MLVAQVEPGRQMVLLVIVLFFLLLLLMLADMVVLMELQVVPAAPAVAVVVLVQQADLVRLGKETLAAVGAHLTVLVAEVVLDRLVLLLHQHPEVLEARELFQALPEVLFNMLAVAVVVERMPLMQIHRGVLLLPEVEKAAVNL